MNILRLLPIALAALCCCEPVIARSLISDTSHVATKSSKGIRSNSPNSNANLAASKSEFLVVHGLRGYQMAPQSDITPPEDVSRANVNLPWIGKLEVSNGESYGRDPNTGTNLKPFGEAYESSSIVGHGLAAPGQVSVGNMNP